MIDIANSFDHPDPWRLGTCCGPAFLEQVERLWRRKRLNVPVRPQQHRAKRQSMEPIECLNGEIKRRADIVGIVPNEASIQRLSGPLLLQQRELPAKAGLTMAELLKTALPAIPAPPVRVQA